MKVAIYARISFQEQETNTSLDNKVRKCIAYSKVYDYDIVFIFKEIGSGTNTEREKYQEVIEMCKNDQIDAVLAYKMDWLHRSSRNLINMAFDLQSMDKQFISVQERIDTTTKTGKLFFTIMSA